MGNCKKCGRCCELIVYTMPHVHLSKDELRYYEMRNIKIERVNRNTDRQIVYAPCVHLTKDKKCAIWDTRPDVCDYSKCKLAFYRPPECTDR